MGPLLLDVATDPCPHSLWVSPPANPMPGIILISSAASRPAIEMFSIMFLFSVWLAVPESVGTTTSAPAATASAYM